MDVTIKSQVIPSCSLEISTKTYFSIQYIRTVDLFIKKAIDIENKELDSTSEPSRLEYQSYCYSAILLSVAFLESTINEFFIEMSDRPQWCVALKEDVIIDSRYHNSIKEYWEKPKSERKSTLKKYQKALELFGRKEISEQDEKYLNVDLLINLRNDLIHAKSEWVHDSPEKNERTKCLKYQTAFQNKFSLNPFMGVGNAFFPDQCIGHGCAKWAIVSAVEFVDYFFQSIELTPKYQYLKKDILNCPPK